MTDPAMEPQEIRAVHYECQRLISLMYHFNDHGQALKTVELVTDDVIFEARVGGGADGQTSTRLVGKESVRKAMESRESGTRAGQLTVHKSSDFILTSVSKTEATGAYYFTTYMSDGKPGDGVPGQTVAGLEGPRHLGEGRCRFRKTEEGWKFAHLNVVFILDADAANNSLRTTYSNMAATAGEHVQSTGKAASRQEPAQDLLPK